MSQRTKIRLTADDLIHRAGGVGEGWELLPDGEALRSGDGFLHPDCDFWVDFACRPDLFRGERERVHSGWPWRRKAAASS